MDSFGRYSKSYNLNGNRGQYIPQNESYSLFQQYDDAPDPELGHTSQRFGTCHPQLEDTSHRSGTCHPQLEHNSQIYNCSMTPGGASSLSAMPVIPIETIDEILEPSSASTSTFIMVSCSIVYKISIMT